MARERDMKVSNSCRAKWSVEHWTATAVRRCDEEVNFGCRDLLLVAVDVLGPWTRSKQYRQVLSGVLDNLDRLSTLRSAGVGEEVFLVVRVARCGLADVIESSSRGRNHDDVTNLKSTNKLVDGRGQAGDNILAAGGAAWERK